MAVWNPWHGCKKISAGCDNCYVYEKDAMYGKMLVIRRTANFDLPVKKNRRGEYKLLPQEEPVYVCMTSDFSCRRRMMAERGVGDDQGAAGSFLCD